MALTIGAFARASRLSPKALRLYDELGLLRPARVDPVSGYRFYEPEQLERARLVAWLRRLGMPLARIRAVCDAPKPEAAAAVAEFWQLVESDTAARRELAAFLVQHLSGKDDAMPAGPLTITYAARTDRGLVREVNQDRAFAGDRVLAVADGFGDDGATASSAAIDALRNLDSAGDLLNVLADAGRQAGSAVRELDQDDSGTTLTALLWSGSRLGLVHIGDSRAYLLRDTELFQITHDHTVVQSLVDEGKLTEDEVATHPQRAILLQALTRDGDPEPDVALHDVHAGDRYLLCSDGLHTVLDVHTLHTTLSGVPSPHQAVERLVDLANQAGGPDNISCVVADIKADSKAG
ncbi:MerR family transcriptional regulator [Actinophytocola gossypii]|uniref:MerR family transcriptional regulator n=1 Tax=Actinophytocola gossypii TaxID=2812003 RepID=A0ABT2JI22_9PSEU|nr:MerR family transcriptional regulator [Actinophytocola gossypii]MCT2587526.1 MerR family transcriptional regulator [Actinophytocola gossypii]